jgi:phage-related protein
LKLIQFGLESGDVKPLVGVAPGLEELRIWDESGTYRVVYLARFVEAVYVLHAFQKKTQTTSKRDLDLIKSRFEDLRRIRERL